MNKTNYQKFLSLSNAEARDFFILYIGLDCFLKGYSIEKLNKSRFIKEGLLLKNSSLLEESFSYRLKIISNGETRYVFYRNSDRKIAILYPDSLSLSFDFLPLEHYEDELPASIVSLLLDVAHNNVKKDEGYKEIEELKWLRKPSNFSYRFILGAGVNHGYGLPSWSELESSFKNEVDGLLGDGACDSTNKAVFNTNYGTFQIVKDILYPRYVDILSSMVSSSVPIPSIHTTLDAVSKVICAENQRHGSQVALTFNYDELLEKSLRDGYSLSCKSVYKGDENVEPSFDVCIVHSHGFVPGGTFPISKKHLNSVVLTTAEYFENYKTPSSYGFSALYSHLDKTCSFVGNSLTDYEEQKVVSAHFDKHPNQFHYWYGAKGKEPIETIMYKTIFLLKMGVIPLWYSDHNDYCDVFLKYANNLMDKTITL